MTTPQDAQNAVNAVPWTNNRGLVTGATIAGLFTSVIAVFALYASLAGPNTFTGANTIGPSGSLTVQGAMTTPALGTPVKVINVTDTQWAGGAKCDFNFGSNTGTDDTAAFAAAIAAAETGVSQGAGLRLNIPSGACLSGPQTITGQIEIDGASDFATVLVLKGSVNAPLFTFQPTGYNFPGDGHPVGSIAFHNFRVTSVDGYAANGTEPNASAFYFPSAGVAWSVRYLFDRVTVYNVPGNCVTANSGNNYALWRDLLCTTAGGYGIATNSTNDWVFDSPIVYFAKGVANISMGGDSNITYHNLNSFSATGAGVQFFGQITASFTGYTSIDHNTLGGVVFNNLTSSAVVKFDDVFFNNNSIANFGYYSDIAVTSGGVGQVLITKGTFEATNSIIGSQSSLYNVQYLAGTTTIACNDCVFRGGNWNVSPQTSSTAHFYATGANSDVPWTVSTLPSPPPAGLATRYRVTDATACSAWHGALTGGGSTPCGAVYLNGSWVQD